MVVNLSRCTGYMRSLQLVSMLPRCRLHEIVLQVVLLKMPQDKGPLLGHHA